MNNFLFKQIDNTGLVLFRAIFGLLISVEALGAIATGWVRQVLVEPNFTFNFIGFDFLQTFQGNGMYYYFILMGVFGLLVMLGYKYRYSMFFYALLWTGTYLMQKTSYNNHYYLMMLLCWLMVFLPANRSFSVDAKNPSFRSSSMPQWCKWVMILQVLIVFTYSSVAKWYPTWFDATAPALFMKAKSNYWLIGDLLQQSWAHYTIAYFGIFFDLLIIPMLLWRRTRLLGFYISIFFHLFNSIVFQVGIFPYMSISFALFFFSSETLQKRFLPKKKLYIAEKVMIPRYKNVLLGVLTCYFIFQIGLPLRHWLIKDDVLWTEEGHRLSWRMMLRSKSGTLSIDIEDKETGERTNYDYKKLVSEKQARSIKTHPDLLWQLAQRIKKLEKENGKDIAVYINSKVSVNGGYYYPYIDPTVDIASQEWNPFKHKDWILPSPKEYHKKVID